MDRYYLLRGRDPDTGAQVEIALLDCYERVIRMRATFKPECGDEYTDLEIVESLSQNQEQRI
jgi:hypothetical protein